MKTLSQNPSAAAKRVVRTFGKASKSLPGKSPSVETRPTPAQQKAARKALEERDAAILQAATEEKEAKAQAKASFKKSKAGKSQSKRTANEIEAAKAAKAKEAEAKKLATANAKLGDAAQAESDFASRHSHADSEAEKGAVTLATSARKSFASNVLKAKDADAYLLLRVSGRGVTLPRFVDGCRVLAFHRGFKPDAEGKYEADEWKQCQRTYNTCNDSLNALLAKVDAAKTSKFTIGASPKVKAKKGGKVNARNAFIRKASKVNLEILAECKAMSLDGWNALLEVCDSSERILNSGASLVVCDPAAFAKKGQGAMPYLGRHLANMRGSKAAKRPAYLSEGTLAMVDRKDGKAYLYKAADLFPKFLTDAQAFNVKQVKAKVNVG